MPMLMYVTGEFGCVGFCGLGSFVFTGTCLLLHFYAWCHMYHNQEIKVILSDLIEWRAV